MLRIALALVNDEANDDHLSVIRVMAYENRIPEKDEFKEAFQPKLYHGTVAALFRILRPESQRAETILAQLVSCLAGLFTLLIAYRFFTGELVSSAKTRFLSFGILALNPPLIGINAQATNDSFVILFASAAFYFGWRFFQNYRRKDFWWMLGFAVLAALSKGTGLVVFFAMMSVFAIILWWTAINHRFPRSTMAVYGTCFFVIYAVLVPNLGPYRAHYRKQGSAVAINKEPNPLPASAFGETFLTFRIGELLRNPILKIGPYSLPENQPSLWSELYARSQFIRFDSWPPGWRLPNENLSQVRQWVNSSSLYEGRLILLFALLPVLLVLCGFMRTVICAARTLVMPQRSKLESVDWLLLFTTIGYIIFIVAVRLRFENFGAMKAIYIYPGFLAFLTLFARECDRFYRWCENQTALRFTCDTIMNSLLFLYVLTVVTLVGQLTFRVYS